MRLPRLSGMLAALLLAACGASSAPAGTVGAAALAASGSGAALRRDGAFMVDEHGRVVLLHGVNVVWKLKPYYPPAAAAGG
jgi:endoglycosylceramidase